MNRDLTAKINDEVQNELKKNRDFDAEGMLQKVSKDLKLTDYRLSRCVTSGTEHFIPLQITNQDEVQVYREYM